MSDKPSDKRSDRPAASLPPLVCSECGTEYGVDTLVWRCTCGGMLDVGGFAPVLTVDRSATSLWRYGSVLPIPCDPSVSMGEGLTPLLRSPARETVRYKLDFLMPTLSFKDRGAVVLATLAKRLGVRRAVVDSSGNAGTSAAAYLARAGVACEVLVPESTSPGKLAQMRAHGATVRLVPGSRADTSAAAVAAAAVPGVFYASHVYHPYFLHGVKTYGYELWEQSGHSLPDTVVLPVGNGTMVLGCHLAFTELHAAGLLERIPAIVAVQAAGCAPLAASMAASLAGGSAEPPSVVPEPTVAEGIAIAAPPRGRQILAAVRATGGTIVTVTDQQVTEARAELAAQGLFVEPTSAVCWAAVRANPGAPAAGALLSAADVVIPLCGAGLKSP